MSLDAFLIARCPVCHIPWPTYTREDLRLMPHGTERGQSDNCAGGNRILEREAYGENGDPRFAPRVPFLTDEQVRALELRFKRIEHMLKALATCRHPYATTARSDWCNVCGARSIGEGRCWIQPVYRDILFDALKDMP